MNRSLKVRLNILTFMGGFFIKIVTADHNLNMRGVIIHEVCTNWISLTG